ncbi:unnamed protein product, partial [Didymodactylos carnosus]
MSKAAIVQDPLKKRRVVIPRGQPEERYCVLNYDWFVDIQLLKRLRNNENELESSVFPFDEMFESHWQMYLEHQSHPSRIRIGLAMLSPRDKSIRADVKLIIITTHGGQIIMEHIFYDHCFFLSQGESISSFISEEISPKVYLDITGELYKDILNDRQTYNADEVTIIANVRFANEIEIQPKTKAHDFSRRFTTEWKLTKLRTIIEQINQSRPPVGNDRRLVSDKFTFYHTKIVDNFKTKLWRLFIKYPSAKQPLVLTLKTNNYQHSNYAKVEIACKKDNQVLRKFTQSFEDLSENYITEFFTLDELSTNIYKYCYEFNENNGRFFTIEYILLSIQIVQQLSKHDFPRTVKRIIEPTMISLTQNGTVQTKGVARMINHKSLTTGTKQTEVDRSISRGNTMTRTASVLYHENTKSPERKNGHASRENFNDKQFVADTWSEQIKAPPPLSNKWEQYFDESIQQKQLEQNGDQTHISRLEQYSKQTSHDQLFPSIVSKNHYTSNGNSSSSSEYRYNHTEMKSLADIHEKLSKSPQQNQKSPRLTVNKQTRFAQPSRLSANTAIRRRSSDTNPPLPSISFSSTWDLPENFTFLSNLFHSGLHSDVTLKKQDY